MSWSPNPESLAQLQEVLSQSTSPNNSVRQQAANALIIARQKPDLDSYLLHLLVTNDRGYKSDIRATCGIMLKNNMHSGFDKLEPSVQQYIKAQVITGLSDPDQLVRNVSGIVITTIFSQTGVASWPEILPQLMTLIEDEHLQTREGAMRALEKICEDNPGLIDQEYFGQRPLNYMIPKLLEVCQSAAASQSIKASCIFCISQFIFLQSGALLAHLDAFISTLFLLAPERDPKTRSNICAALVSLMDIRPEKIIPHLEGIINYCLDCIKDSDEKVALDGAEFIFALAESTTLNSAYIEPHLSRILPILLSTMVYSESQRAQLEYEQEDDEAIADKSEDIRPTMVKSRVSHGSRQKNTTNLEGRGIGHNKDGQPLNTNASDAGAIDFNNNNSIDKSNSDSKNSTGLIGNGNGIGKENKAEMNLHNNTKGSHNDDEDDDDDDDDDDYYDDDDDDDSTSEWNLRKCSAASLDLLSLKYPSILIDTLLPFLRVNLTANEWYVREASMLAFGAMADGCLQFVGPHLPSLIPFLVQSLNDSQPAVRMICCWTLARYSSWIAESARKGDHSTFLVPVLDGLMRCCSDRNKKVQDAGCSGFATFATETGKLLAPYLEGILQQLGSCLYKYQSKNLIVLYDAIQVLVEELSALLRDQKYINLLLPPLLWKWEQLGDRDDELWALLACLSSVCIALEDAFAPFAAPVFERALKIVRENLLQQQMHQNDPQYHEPAGSDFLISALDLLDGLIQGLGSSINVLFAQTNSQSLLTEMMLMCFQDPVEEVRQSAFALLGDMAVSCYEQIEPQLDQFMGEIIPNIDASDQAMASVCNNATWSAGEIAIRARARLNQYLETLFQKAIRALNTRAANQSVLENAAILLGRLGFVDASVLAPHIDQIIDLWCFQMKDVLENDEKDTAYQGLCMIVEANPSGLSESSLSKLLSSIALYEKPSQPLASHFCTLIQGYKQLVPDWLTFVNSYVDPSLSAKLQAYGA